MGTKNLTYPESPKMITFSRVRLRDAMVVGSAPDDAGVKEKCGGGARDAKKTRTNSAKKDP